MTQPPYPDYGSTESTSYPRAAVRHASASTPTQERPDTSGDQSGGQEASDSMSDSSTGFGTADDGFSTPTTYNRRSSEDEVPAAGTGTHEFGTNGQPPAWPPPADSTYAYPAPADSSPYSAGYSGGYGGYGQHSAGEASTSQFAADLGATALTSHMASPYGSASAPPIPGVPPTPGMPGGARSAGTASPPSVRPSVRSAARGGPRRARLQLRHINVWSALKFSCVLSIALFFVWLIAVGVLYGLLDAGGVFERINDAIVKINGTGSKKPVTAGVVFGGATIIGAINIVLFIALSTIGAIVYNLCADLVGGIEVTLSERE